MAISFSEALGVHESALKLRARRAEVLANNLANADTPGFKARDMDFKAELDRIARPADSSSNISLSKTQSGHLDGNGLAGGDVALGFRIPNQSSIDGNTVEDQVEHAAFMKNALDFQASFMLLNKKFKGLSSAITGQ